MPSILPGFEYDIFISYRQKDNKTGWVTEFVESLKNEIEATFKEDISIYFDSNPRDGLHETHDVDGSLKEKIKSLVFIPIVSQTYCDPNAFAWQKEFLPFLDFAKNDEFGLDIRLPGGNISKRVLPVRIHEIDEADKKLFEDQIDGVMRQVDFIFKSSGVNRPLLHQEDDPGANQNHTHYRDQLNKVANAIKEIIEALRSTTQPSDYVITNSNSSETNASVIPPSPKKNKTIWLAGSALVILLALAYFIYPDISGSSTIKSENKSIAVLYFDNMSGDPDQEYFSDGLTEEIISRLVKINELKVISRNSVKVYKGQPLNTKKIAEELGVSAILEGSVRKSGNQYRVTAQLIDASTDEHIWSEDFNHESTNAIQIQIDIAKAIARKFDIKVSPEVNLQVSKIPTTSEEAYDLYTKGRYFLYSSNQGLEGTEKAIEYFGEAIRLDSTFAEAIAGLAESLDSKLNWIGRDNQEELMARQRKLADRALSLNPQSDYTHLTKIWELLHRIRGKPLDSTFLMNRDSAFFHLKKSIMLGPNDPTNLWQAGGFYISDESYLGLNNLAIPFLEKSLALDPFNLGALRSLAWCYMRVGNEAKAKESLYKAIKLDPDYGSFSEIAILTHYADFKEAQRLINLADESNKDYFQARLMAAMGQSDSLVNAYKDDIFVMFYQGRIKESLSLLENSIDQGFPQYFLLKEAMSYENMEKYKNDPDYIRVLNKAKKKFDEDSKKFNVDDLLPLIK